MGETGLSEEHAGFLAGKIAREVIEELKDMLHGNANALNMPETFTAVRKIVTSSHG